MIHEQPILRPLGDCYLSVEFGDEASLLLSFRVLALQDALRAAAIAGIVEIHPTTRQLAVIFDRSRLTYAQLARAVEEMLPQVQQTEELPSRLFRIPVWYDDPWSAETARRFDAPNNIRLVAELNGVEVEEFIRQHSAPDYWVALLGAPPGNNLQYPLDGAEFSAPKYVTPRTFTPARAVGIAGRGTCIYGTNSPGGYQLLGRTPLDVYESAPRYAIFPEDGILLSAGDRIRYAPVDALEYDEIRERFVEGGYEYEILGTRFSVGAYLAREAA